jgi:hypothetical protein
VITDSLGPASARLRDAVRRQLAGHPDAELALARYEADPQSGHVPLMQELARVSAGDDADLVADALALIELIKRAGE